MRIKKDIEDLEAGVKTFKRWVYDKFTDADKKCDRMTYFFIANLAGIILLLLKELVWHRPGP